ncbi:MAG: hypothetical protein GY749_23570 [Desulfobacteraceae bacterium]|nr:hypothetical protein [Desulfobacteraceae bacterium]
MMTSSKSDSITPEKGDRACTDRKSGNNKETGFLAKTRFLRLHKFNNLWGFTRECRYVISSKPRRRLIPAGLSDFHLCIPDHIIGVALLLKVSTTFGQNEGCQKF